MPSATEVLAATQAQKPQRSSMLPRSLATISPERAEIAASFMRHYHALLDAAVDLEDMLKLQDTMLPPRARRSLVPSTSNKRIKALVEAAMQCLDIATLIPRMDTKTGDWCVPVVPPLPGYNLLPHQDEKFLSGLGTYHKLYVGKYAYLYGSQRGVRNERRT